MTFIRMWKYINVFMVGAALVAAGYFVVDVERYETLFVLFGVPTFIATGFWMYGRMRIEPHRRLDQARRAGALMSARVESLVRINDAPRRPDHRLALTVRPSRGAPYRGVTTVRAPSMRLVAFRPGAIVWVTSVPGDSGRLNLVSQWIDEAVPDGWSDVPHDMPMKRARSGLSGIVRRTLALARIRFGVWIGLAVCAVSGAGLVQFLAG